MDLRFSRRIILEEIKPYLPISHNSFIFQKGGYYFSKLWVVVFAVMRVNTDCSVNSRVAVDDFNNLFKIGLICAHGEHILQTLPETSFNDFFPIFLKVFHLEMAMRINKHEDLYHI